MTKSCSCMARMSTFRIACVIAAIDCNIVPGLFAGTTATRPANRGAAEFLGISLANMLLRLRFGGVRQWLGIPLVYLSRWWIVLYRPGFARGLLALVPKFFQQAPAFLRSRHTSRQAFPFRGVGYELARDRVPIAQPKISDAGAAAGFDRDSHVRRAARLFARGGAKCPESNVSEDRTDRRRRWARHASPRAFLTSATQKTALAVRYLTTPKGGRCRSGNAGLGQARGEYLGFLDDDDYFFADHVETLIAPTLERFDVRGGVCGRVGNCDERSLAKIRSRTKKSRTARFYRQPYCRGMLWQRNYIPIQSILFHRRFVPATRRL